MKIDNSLTIADLAAQLQQFWKLSGEKIRLIAQNYDERKGAPVFTAGGKYTSRGWTEWTQGFLYGSALLQYEVSAESELLDYARTATRRKMAAHVGHFGVHDHGFNNVSTYGNLLRLMKEGRILHNEWEQEFYELALKLSGAVQARRWTSLPDGGYIYSFNGPHSLFVDTIRTLRVLLISHELGHALWEEQDTRVSLLQRAVQHAIATANYSIYYGEGRDRYDEWGRTAHESIFNVNNGQYRCPNAQQGFSGYTTWTRGLAWAMTGFAELLEYLHTADEQQFVAFSEKAFVESVCLKAARATCDFYLSHTPADGIPYWDTGAPMLHKLGDYLDKASDPYNEYEPVDSSAAAIGAQGLLRLGRYLRQRGDQSGWTYWQAGLTVVKHLLDDPYLSRESTHEGLILHSIYHQPNGWDHVPQGHKVACGESSMWGDYHARELALYLQRMLEEQPYYAFFNCVK